MLFYILYLHPQKVPPAAVCGIKGVEESTYTGGVTELKGSCMLKCLLEWDYLNTGVCVFLSRHPQAIIVEEGSIKY